MNIWKPILFTCMAFFGIAFIAVYTACEPNPCKDVFCNNGGVCQNGVCTCLVGFEGPHCDDKVSARFIGVYAGYTTCNNGAQVIDTVIISDNPPKGATAVKVLQKTLPNTILYGYVSHYSDQSYDITFLDSVSKNYHKTYNVMWQRTNTGYSVTLHTVEHDSTIAGNILKNDCIFVGSRR